MGIKLTRKDRAMLAGVHPDLVAVVEEAARITTVNFKVTEGLRTVARQKELVAKGVSKTMNSRHLDGHAVDLIPLYDKDRDGTVSNKEMWDWPAYYLLAKIIKQAAANLKVPIEWGGDWKTFKDGPHWQLPWAKYPKGGNPGTATAAASGIHSAEVATAPQYTDETDTSAATKSVAIGAAGATTAGGIAAEPIAVAVESITTQQMELTSGDWVRIAIAAVIVGAAIWFAYKKAKGGGHGS